MFRKRKRHPAPSPMEIADQTKTPSNSNTGNFKTTKLTLVEISKEMEPEWERILELTCERYYD